jgi:hypothetical protein
MPRKPVKKDEPEPSGVLPMQLRVGDRFTDETGEWEIVGRPYGTVGGKSVHARVSRRSRRSGPGAPMSGWRCGGRRWGALVSGKVPHSVRAERPNNRPGRGAYSPPPPTKPRKTGHVRSQARADLGRKSGIGYAYVGRHEHDDHVGDRHCARSLRMPYPLGVSVTGAANPLAYIPRRLGTP